MFLGRNKNLFFKWAKSGLFLFIFVFFAWQIQHKLTIMIKATDGVLGTRTWGGTMVGADDSSSTRTCFSRLLRVYIPRYLNIFGPATVQVKCCSTEWWNWPSQASFSSIFAFVNKRDNFTTNMWVKMSIQNAVLGFKLTAFRTRVSSQGSRPTWNS